MIQRLALLGLVATLFVVLAATSPYFLTGTNLSSVVRQTAVINTMALGMTLVIVAGGIDLSVGSILAFSGLMGCMAMEAGAPIPAGLAVGLVAGAFWGCVNGLLSVLLRINPFIVTLGTLGIVRGLTLQVSNGLPVHRIPQAFSFLGGGNLLGVPVVLWILVACALATHVILEHTRLGRYSFAIGSNPEAAFYTGIPVSFHTAAVYAISGLLCGLAGMIEASRLMTGQPTAGLGYELRVIAAVVIGGGSLRGGEGSVIGTLLGAFFMGLLANGADLHGISPYWQEVIIGGVIILAVSVDELLRKFRLR
ncbi:MAG: ABC transporter permease [Acidobacteria bacterium]|nr:ABC transporter permease [Acidobacteriota bacterium]